MPLLDAILFGLALGFSLTIPPGPMNALIAAQAARSLRRGIVTGLGAMSADLILGALVYALRDAVDIAPVVRYVYAVGAAVMAFLAYRILRVRGPVGPSEVPDLRTYSQALGVGLSNPFQIVWWLSAGIAFAYLGGLVLYAALFAAVLVWVIAFPYAIHLGTRSRPKLARLVPLVSGAILLGFAAYFALLAIA
ncbi:MAG TPA: LysE family transporter [Thermoplasmata archaeon]|nr:LysE family transporter [Thermoplasmata archaeon]